MHKLLSRVLIGLILPSSLLQAASVEDTLRSEREIRTARDAFSEYIDERRKETGPSRFLTIDEAYYGGTVEIRVAKEFAMLTDKEKTALTRELASTWALISPTTYGNVRIFLPGENQPLMEVLYEPIEAE
ncbi:MAG: hypothetical protein GY696_21745 [Gammaproteobacteria bacterium]|nr:hypothetical protein [Gammaproteobacteria bacterium]